MDRNKLQELLESGKSTNEIAPLMGVASGSTVRHWMKKYGLVSKAKAGAKPIARPTDGTSHCKQCNVTKSVEDFYKSRHGNPFPTCKLCSIENGRDRYITLKSELVAFKGGKCQRCNEVYDIKAYDFHHIDPEHKDFNIAEKRGRPFVEVASELHRCICVCANCHAEIHDIMKQTKGYSNKIDGNTELYQDNRQRKLDHMGAHKCSACDYDYYTGALCIIFPEESKHYIKYNKTHWDDEFTAALDSAKVLCKNCVRTQFDDAEED